MSLSPQWLDELRARVTLSGVIQRTTRLQKAGREWRACCPFHNEKSPSFFVNDEKGFYHCFGCGAHGDVIRWMTDQRGLPFIDAVKELAAEAGMELPALDRQAAAKAEVRQSLHDVMAAAQDWFAARLASAEGAAARAYLARRGVAQKLAEAFGFGLAPDDRNAIGKALSQFPTDMLFRAGLLIEIDGKAPYDRFRGRLMLPIRDPRGRVIAFGGRMLDPTSNGPKYLNSPETELFDKGRTLYNLHRAAPAARAANRVIVVEGYMDAVGLAVAGIDEAVAPLGTALTEPQIERLWQVHPCPVLCFDGDAAGQRAAMRAALRALPLLKPGHSLRIVTLPEGMDPDDLVKRDGRAGIEAELSGGRSLVELLWDVECAAAPLVTPEDKAGLKARLMDHVDTIQHPDIKALYRRDLLERFDALAFARRERPQQQGSFRKSERGGGKGWQPPEPPLAPADAARLQQVGAQDLTLVAILQGLMTHPQVIARSAEQLAGLQVDHPQLRRILSTILAAADGQALENGRLQSICAERGLSLPPLAAYANRNFGFLDPADPGGPEQLTTTISLRLLEQAFIEASRRYQREETEEARLEQERVRKQMLAFRERLQQMARAAAEQAR